MPDLSWSPLPAPLESHLQTHVFLERMAAQE
jgi:hypothetical protein